MTDFFRNIVKELNDENTNVAADGLGSSEFGDTIDTGSYILNAALSGSITGGAPNNKVLALAGESATGKTFFALGMVRRFLSDNPTGAVFYFDTENMFSDRYHPGLCWFRRIYLHKSSRT